MVSQAGLPSSRGLIAGLILAELDPTIVTESNVEIHKANAEKINNYKHLEETITQMYHVNKTMSPMVLRPPLSYNNKITLLISFVLILRTLWLATGNSTGCRPKVVHDRGTSSVSSKVSPYSNGFICPWANQQSS
ncbi:hypothetical protein DPMN_173584 [Dreissena polymorpha]|uniref:Uncharacterized protein n=1 Tax=Dreissena polymorpha TaxID=45954 RepID=A0A9D4E2Z1_DREPO|nr:hypothetical protein DPMN_173584 [Dreissena polymorpha]